MLRNTAEDKALNHVLIATIFNTMRILKKVNPGDCYLENYLGHYARNGKDFYDTYMLLWEIAVTLAPKRILEIGTRTGISLCQLLSAYIDNSIVETIVCVDPFDQWTSPNLVRANLAYLGLPHDQDTVKIHPITSDEYFSMERGEDFKPFQFILVDGDHSKEACRKDLDNAHKLIAKAGIIVCDDLSQEIGECGLIVVWEEWKKNHLDEYEFFEDLRGKGVGYAIRK